MTIVLETHVVAIGNHAKEMLSEANMVILFGLEAPADLAEYCYKISNHEVQGSISVGGKLAIDGVSYPITAVGSLVYQNLSALGHITISLDGATQPSLPGTLHVAATSTPSLCEDSMIVIEE